MYDLLTFLGSFIFIILLIILLAKIYNINWIPNKSNYKYVEIVEKSFLNKETYIAVVKLGKKHKVMLINKENTTVIENLTEEDSIYLEKIKKEQLDEILKNKENFRNNLKKISKRK